MSNQLLPCPFCGGPAKAAEAYIRGDQAFAHIHCENHCEVAPSAGASSALFYWSDLRKENVRIHSDDKAKLEATELAHAKWNRRATQPDAGEPKWSCLNSWFLSLEPGRQAVLREDKWMLAGAAFDAGRQYLAPPAAAPVAAGEPLATWVALTAAGQLRKGDKIRFRFGQETLTETVALVLDAGTEREEVVYNRKRNFYFITSKALAGTSSAKEVEVLRTMAAPPAAAHGDEAVRKDSERYRFLKSEVNQSLMERLDCNYPSNEWDIHIDAAMRAQGDGGEV